MLLCWKQGPEDRPEFVDILELLQHNGVDSIDSSLDINTEESSTQQLRNNCSLRIFFDL